MCRGCGKLSRFSFVYKLCWGTNYVGGGEILGRQGFNFVPLLYGFHNTWQKVPIFFMYAFDLRRDI
jgi:hypothetical protein